MTTRRAQSGARSPIRRAAVVMAVSLGLVVSAIGPANVAAAPAPPAPPAVPGMPPLPHFGPGGPDSLKKAIFAPWYKLGDGRTPTPGWPVSNVPLHITAPTAQIYGLSQVVPGARVRQANGQLSAPETYYLEVQKLELDDIRITSEHADHTWLLANPNGGKQNKSTTLTIGNDHKSTKVGLWVQIDTLKLCITPETLYTIVRSEQGELFEGRIDEVLELIKTVFQPYREGPLKNVGPCIPIRDLLPIVGVILGAGIPLPELPVIKLDLRASAVRVDTPTDQPSVRGPVAQVRMFQ